MARRALLNGRSKAVRSPSELIVRSNKGLCATLNESLTHSKGKYFAYLSSDDAWLPKFLEARVGLLETQPDAILAHGRAYVIDEMIELSSVRLIGRVTRKAARGKDFYMQSAR